MKSFRSNLFVREVSRLLVIRVPIIGIVFAVALMFAGKVQAETVTVTGTPVGGFNSTAPVAPLRNDGFLEFFIPISAAASGTLGANNVGLVADTGTGNGSLDLFFNLGSIQSLNNINLTFSFIDLDLNPVNDPNGFFETVQFFSQNFRTGTITATGQNVANFYTVAGNSDTQSIVFSDLSPFVLPANGDPFILGLHFTTLTTTFGLNTSEFVRAVLSGTAVPEPATLLLVGMGAFATYRRRKQAV